MNTSGSGSAQPLDSAVNGLDVGAPAGWPDAGLIERIANDLFNALPGTDLPIGQTNTLPSTGLQSGTSPAHASAAAFDPSTPLDIADVPSHTAAPRPQAPVFVDHAVPQPTNRHGAAMDSGSEAPLGGIAPPRPAAGSIPSMDPAYYFLSSEHGMNGVSGIDIRPLPIGIDFLGHAQPAELPWNGDAPASPRSAVPGTTSHRGSPAGLSNNFDIAAVRRDFPILSERVSGGRPLVWLDNAATTQKPRSVIDRLSSFYEHENSNIHRAAHELAARSTDAYEGAREKVRGFLNAASPNEIVFVRGATEGINLIAQSWGRQNIKSGDEIIVSWLEHHANIVPWQQLTQATGAVLRVIPVDEHGQILLHEYAKLLGPKTKLVSITHVSNALGTIVPVTVVAAMAHAVGAKVLVDGAQAVSHMPVDVRAIDADWYVFSGHKVFAPTGIGVVYGKEAILNAMDPWQGGGNMIADVTFEKTVYHKAPARFEAGTGNIADAVGLGAAIDYVTSLGMHAIEAYEHQLLEYATRLMKDIPRLRLIGTAPDKAGVLSFVIDGMKTEDVGAALSREGIAVRSGHHCAQPILRRFGLEATVRPSLAFYNDCSDIDALIMALVRLTSQGGRVRHY